jgi:protoporphyrinogen oxidase
VIRAFLRLQKEKEVTNITKEDVIEQWKKELEEAGIDESKQKFKPEDFTLFSKPALNPVCAIVGSMLSQEAIKV